MSSGLPDRPDGERDAGRESRIVHIDNLHLHSNDIDALRRLAETDPELAHIVVQQKDLFHRRGHASYRFGIIAACALLLGMLLAFSYILVNLGIILSLVLVACIVAAALFIRVILTGEWSDTSVVGQIVNGIVTTLGGKPK